MLAIDEINIGAIIKLDNPTVKSEYLLVSDIDITNNIIRVFCDNYNLDENNEYNFTISDVKFNDESLHDLKFNVCAGMMDISVDDINHINILGCIDSDRMIELLKFKIKHCSSNEPKYNIVYLPKEGEVYNMYIGEWYDISYKIFIVIGLGYYEGERAVVGYEYKSEIDLFIPASYLLAHFQADDIKSRLLYTIQDIEYLKVLYNSHIKFQLNGYPSVIPNDLLEIINFINKVCANK